MKHKIAIAGIFAAAALLTPAQATTILFNTTLNNNTTYTQGQSVSLGTGNGSVKLYGYDGVFSAPNPPVGGVGVGTATTPNSDDPNHTSSPGTIVTSAGLGDHNSGNPDIAPGDAVVLDFSAVSSTIKPTASNLQFNMTIDANGPSYWVIYGSNGGAYTQLLASGPMEAPTVQNGLTGTYNPSNLISVSVSAQYSEYLVGITNDCDLTINSITDTGVTTTTTPTPEPGTFLMAGMALVAVGLTMKKRSRKA